MVRRTISGSMTNSSSVPSGVASNAGMRIGHNAGQSASREARGSICNVPRTQAGAESARASTGPINRANRGIVTSAPPKPVRP